MNQTVIIIYDCPLKECDKLWVGEELKKKGHNIKVITPFLRISQIEQRGGIGKAAARLLTFHTCLLGLFKSRSGDIVFCWSQWSGLFFNQLPGAKKRHIISYNWLTPVPNKKTRFLYANALKNSKMTIVINSPGTKSRLEKDYGVMEADNIVCIPDVYDGHTSFAKPSYTKDSNERYCFTGGRANRDWKLLLNAAQSCPDIRFIAVAAGASWDKELKIPSNVTLYFDLSQEEYYRLMEGAYVIALPLKEDRVSGLINILKSIQAGIPVITTKTEATEMYFGEEAADLLTDFQDELAFINKLKEVYAYERMEYEEKVHRLQQHVKDTFSPRHGAEKIESIIRERCRDV